MTGALLARKMAGGKKRVDHVAWQIEVTTNEEWEDLIKLQGLIGELNYLKIIFSRFCFKKEKMLLKSGGRLLGMVRTLPGHGLPSQGDQVATGR